MGKTCLCIDVGGSSIKYGKIEEDRKIFDYGKVPTPYDGVEVYLDCLEEIFRKFEGQVEGISMSVPGIIDSGNGICVTAGNLRYADGLHLVEELEKRVEVPVAIMNDAKCAALAEAAWGALSDCKDGVVLVLGTGIGGALIKDGQIHMGNHFAAGEFSFITMTENVDDMANAWASVNGNPRLVEMAARLKGMEKEEVDGELIFKWLEEGDKDIEKLLDEFTRVVARMIMNLQFIYDPERFAIGGGISRQPKLIEYIQRNLDYLYAVYPHYFPKAQVTVCQYFNEANLIGAYGNFVRRKS